MSGTADAHQAAAKATRAALRAVAAERERQLDELRAELVQVAAVPTRDI